MRMLMVVLASVYVFPVRGGLAQAVALSPAARIRYALGPSEKPATAEVIVQRGDSLWVRSLQTNKRLIIALPALTRLDISRGQDGHGRRGAGVGLLMGAAGGAIRGYFAGRGCHESWCASSGELAKNGAITFGLIGAGVGAIVGARHKTDRWEAVPLTVMVGDRAVSPHASALGFGLTLTISGRP